MGSFRIDRLPAHCARTTQSRRVRRHRIKRRAVIRDGRTKKKKAPHKAGRNGNCANWRSYSLTASARSAARPKTSAGPNAPEHNEHGRSFGRHEPRSSMRNFIKSAFRPASMVTSRLSVQPPCPNGRAHRAYGLVPQRGRAEMTARRDSSTYGSEIASPLRSALAINPTCGPDSVNTAPFSLLSTIARAPTPSAAPAPAAP